jgi:protein-disulfide isomerase
MSQSKARQARRAVAQDDDTRLRAARRRNAKISATLAAIFVAVVVGLLTLGPNSERGQGSAAGDGASGTDTPVVRDDSRRLGVPGDSEVTLVEFLDFECEACGAAFPIIEELRDKYRGQVTFVARYFPIQSHFNAERAARAVEAAAQQGEFEAMYQRMYETQPQWAEQQEPKDDVFRGFARDLGLDVAQWEEDYNDPATMERINTDVADGVALGVQGTPTFFLNGEKFEPRSAEDFTEAIDAALAD